MATEKSGVFHNLAVPLTRFIGREREIALLRQMLAGDSTRLLTLTGIGGAGKTRLALEVARTLAVGGNDAVFPDGIYWAELAPLADPRLVAQTVGAAVGLRDLTGQQSLEMLIQTLRLRRTMLILDNCEHLADGCAELAHGLLVACADLVILATSRSPLHLPGERVFQEPPLEVISVNERVRLTNLIEGEAVRLFVDRAKLVHWEFAPEGDDRLAIIQICERLDGIPLAIELAAARTTLLTPRQIARRLEDVFSLLRNTGSDSTPRHRSLRVAFEWSHALLSTTEQILFRRLAVFRGGWTLRAAEQVTGDQLIHASQVLDLHGRLLDNSLITRMDDGRGEQARYRMLEPVRQFALEKLAATAESPKLSDRHFAYFLALAKEGEQGVLTPAYGGWIRRITEETGNLRVALNWADTTRDIEGGLRLAVALFHYWYHWGFVPESIRTLLQLMSYQTPKTKTHVRTLAILSLSYLRLGDHEQTIQAAESCLAEESNLPDAGARVVALAALGHGKALQGRFDQAIAALEESLSIARALDDAEVLAWPLWKLANVAMLAHNWALAEELLAELCTRMRAAGNHNYLSVGLRYWGLALLQSGDTAQAAAKFREEGEIASWGTVEPMVVAAFVALAVSLGQDRRAVRLLGATEALTDLRNGFLLPYDQEILDQNASALHDQVDEVTFHILRNEGKRLSPEETRGECLAVVTLASEPGLRNKQSLAGLTEREIDVLRLVAVGLSNQEIADRLVVSPRTVHAHLRSIFGKLDVNTRTAAAHEALRQRLV